MQWARCAGSRGLVQGWQPHGGSMRLQRRGMGAERWAGSPSPAVRAAVAAAAASLPPACWCLLQKNSVAVAYVKRGKGEIRLNGEERGQQGRAMGRRSSSAASTRWGSGVCASRGESSSQSGESSSSCSLERLELGRQPISTDDCSTREMDAAER